MSQRSDGWNLDDLRCAVCGVHACSSEPGVKDYPDFCPTPNEDTVLSEAREMYDADEMTRRISLASARVEAKGYCRWSRMEEIVHFAHGMGVKKVGIATCLGLLRESSIAHRILKLNGFDVVSVCCKVGSISKDDVGLNDDEKVRPGGFEALCNPVAQAKLLNAAGSELNVVVGLCVGHDSLFFKYSDAPCTTLITKDRVLCHNPAGALYQTQGYYKFLLNGPLERK